MTYLKCRVGKKLGCRWRINDEAYDGLGQLIEHERECAHFIGNRVTAEYVADHLSAERVAHLAPRRIA